MSSNQTFFFTILQKTIYGLKSISEILAPKLDKELSRKIILPKNPKPKDIPENFDEVYLLAYTQPKLTGIGKKLLKYLNYKLVVLLKNKLLLLKNT